MAQITLNSSGVASSGSLLLQTNGTTTQATVDTSGNLGLGVTPSAWSASYKALQVGSRGAFWGNASGNDIYLSTNYFFDGAQKYIANGYATFYSQNNGAHSWHTAGNNVSGAGASAAFTQAMTLDASGRLGIGTTSPGDKLTIAAGASTGAAMTFWANGVTSSSELYVGQGGSNEAYFFNRANSYLVFGTNNNERARIDSSGKLLVNSPAYSDGTISIKPVSGTASISAGVINNGNNAVNWYNASNSYICSIVVNSASVAYNTSSDYRLKDNVSPMTGALAKVAALRPVTWTWKEDGSDGQGFIAHEVQAIVPDAVSGEKDAVDENGNPKYQGIDTSFLVATLTAALQEAHGLIKDLQTRIEALEA